MDLVMKTKQTLKIISSFIFLLVFVSCFKENTDSTFESLIKSTSVEVNKTYKIKLKDNIRFHFDKLYVFEGPRFPSEIEKVTKIKFDDVLDDGERLYLYVSNEAIVKQEKSTSMDVNIHRLMNDQGYTILNSETIVCAKRQKNGNDFYFDTFW